MSDVLYVPQLSYNLLSMSKATQSGKEVKFTENDCYITDMNQKIMQKKKTFVSHLFGSTVFAVFYFKHCLTPNLLLMLKSK